MAVRCSRQREQHMQRPRNARGYAVFINWRKSSVMEAWNYRKRTVGGEVGEVWGHCTEKGLAWVIVEFRGPWGLGWRTI